MLNSYVTTIDMANKQLNLLKASLWTLWVNLEGEVRVGVGVVCINREAGNQEMAT